MAPGGLGEIYFPELVFSWLFILCPVSSWLNVSSLKDTICTQSSLLAAIKELFTEEGKLLL